jgi:hypothetical protein
MEPCEITVVVAAVIFAADELIDDWSAGSVGVVFGVAFILALMFDI